jgi:pentapeptide MXKDX repeat protein
MTTWKCALTLTVAAAMVATTAFAQSGGSTTAPGAKQAESGASSSSDTGKPAESSPSASPSTTSPSTPSASPGTSTTDTMKSDGMKSDGMKSDGMKSHTMKSDRMSKGRMRAAGGDREQMKAVQQALKDKGHDPGAVDGVMGPKTRAALKDFQKKEGMKDTGRLDRDTLSKLGVDTRTGSASPASGSATSGSASPATSTESGAKKSEPGATEKK